MSRQITERMADTIADLRERWNGKRWPKAFYLKSDDWAAFMATNPPTVETMFGNNPPRLIVEPSFEGVPVRDTEAKTSRLYSNYSSGRELVP